MICALVLIIGFLLVIIGHKYAHIDRLISSCMMGGIFGYTLAIGISDYSTTSNYTISILFKILMK